MSISFGILSTYPPTACGVASFSRSLAESLRTLDTVGVVQVVDATDEPALHDGVVHQWVRGSAGGELAATAALNQFDVAIVQHEYGIYGGRDGLDVLDAVTGLRVPVVLVVHTVLPDPSHRQRLIVQEMVSHSSVVVTMTRAARDRLVKHYAVDVDKVCVVPHGAHPALPTAPPETAAQAAAPAHHGGSAHPRRPVILTWGLLRDGKGIEWAIEAMAQLRDLQPIYRVVGQTHPRTLDSDGERYRHRLTDRAQHLGVTDLVEFDPRYLDGASLQRLVSEADVVLLPNDSTEQLDSGVLAEAVSAGKPIVATGFPHALEALASGAGLLVARQDPTALADGLRRVLTDRALAASMSAEAIRLAPEMLWPTVAQQYRDLASHALAGSVLEAV